MMKAIIHIDSNHNKMQSRIQKESQKIFGKTVLNILKDTLESEWTLISKADLMPEDPVIFFMGNVPLLCLDAIKADLKQYEEDLIFFKDERENPLALYINGKTLGKGIDLIKSQWLSFSDLLTDLKMPYRVEIIESTLCIFDKRDLHEATKRIQRILNNKHLDQGVTIIDMESTYIDFDVAIEMDTVIYPNSFLTGRTLIGEGCEIGPAARIDNSKIGHKTVVKDSTILSSEISSETSVGPYAYIRPNSFVGSHVKIGDFVEVKNAKIGDHTKISHLSYVGDADLGEHVNVGCGVVFVNYNGKDKSRSTVGDNVFIGCNSNIVAPVVLEELAYVAAGTTVTKKVESGDLAVGRAKQENKKGWVERRNLISKK
ncbi:MAG: UDP-N-acetylglucosamine pyrophosphorylase [Clostridia bacterium]|nr:UDP-N-acetylglucosamine pyrophosphorylase [Clostridia bacterium]